MFSSGVQECSIPFHFLDVCRTAKADATDFILDIAHIDASKIPCDLPPKQRNGRSTGSRPRDTLAANYSMYWRN
jgi:hypothetical protein